MGRLPGVAIMRIMAGTPAPEPAPETARARGGGGSGRAAVTTAYAAAGWTNFGLAAAGTAATLAGLLFVAVSINLKQILEFPNLPARAGQTLILFATPLI